MAASRMACYDCQAAKCFSNRLHDNDADDGGVLSRSARYCEAAKRYPEGLLEKGD